ncbi:hypothetical protein [Microbacterium sp. H6]|uniref:hypothetical protein n=1 Tax=Microbacterium sp. H6 TaxID=421122 RepID=UPI000DE47917|nr:hypothetical protein [Microbacterium sp. H6]RBO73494.1 hypothetical protein DSP71_04885 [Microbacterium sp. H6]
MAKDERLYMTFPNDFHRHPKLRNQPAEVKWAFVEMNGEARIADNDGRFSAEDAEFLWSADILEALTGSHPTRPLVVRDGTDYVIREYSKHQQTKADREARSAARAEAGRKGGLAKAQASASKSQADDGNQKQSQSQSQSHQTSTHVSESPSRDTRASDVTDAQSETYRSTLASQYGIDVMRIRAHIFDRLGMTIAPEDTVNVSIWILNKIKTPPRAPTKYVLAAITRSPAEVQQYIHENGLV